MRCLYILEINPSSVALFANIFSHSEGHLLILFIASHSSVGKESACNAGDPGSLPGSGRSTGEGIGFPLCVSLPAVFAAREPLGASREMLMVKGSSR